MVRGGGNDTHRSVRIDAEEIRLKVQRPEKDGVVLQSLRWGRKVNRYLYPGIILILISTATAGDRSVFAGDDAKRIEVHIRKENAIEGHQTIGIDEDGLNLEPGEEEFPLMFSKLMTWPFEIDNPSAPPEDLKKIDNRRVRIIGFMFPLEEGKSIRFFCLLRTTQTCCYGPRPQFNQYVFVEMSEPAPFSRFDPVACTGRFKIDPAPQEGFIYRLEGEKCGILERKAG